MKTFFVWQMFDEGLRYGMVNYDASHLENKFINLVGTTGDEEEELNKLSAVENFAPSLQDWAASIGEAFCANERYCVIECGFVP